MESMTSAFSTVTLSSIATDAGTVIPWFLGLMVVSLGVYYGQKFLKAGKRIAK